MVKQKTARVSDIVGLLNQICPPELAEDWDNVGLQVGDPEAEIHKILVCLDAEEPAVDEALNCGAELIISHHPLIFRALKRLSPTDMTGRVLFRAIQNHIAVVSAHTNLDRAEDGLNDWLASCLGLTDSRPLEPPETGHYYKLVVYVPVGHEREVMDAVFSAGAGHIGAYDRCSFRVTGTGSFRGQDDTQPFIGSAGKFEEAEEVRLETIVPQSGLSKVVARVLKAHPYEEVAYDLIPLANNRPGVGLGRIGVLNEPGSLEMFAERVKEALGLTSLRIVGDLNRKIRKIAVCGGTGMSTYSDALYNGADCLVTGDIKYHEAQRARADGVALVDAGHFATERLMIAELSKRLRLLCRERQFALEICEMKTEQDPFVTFP